MYLLRFLEVFCDYFSIPPKSAIKIEHFPNKMPTSFLFNYIKDDVFLEKRCIFFKNYPCFILIYFRKLNKIHQNVQRFSLNTFGETTSPLSRKDISCPSVIAFPFLSIPIAPFMSAFKVFPQADLNNPLLILLPLG